VIVLKLRNKDPLCLLVPPNIKVKLSFAKILLSCHRVSCIATKSNSRSAASFKISWYAPALYKLRHIPRSHL
ncbi:hypothetical protein TSAR_013580, partial [Trichomalopsis sarcophagae]